MAVLPFEIAPEDLLELQTEIVNIEGKTRRKGYFDAMFDAHNLNWLTEFTLLNPDSYRYAVTVDFRRTSRWVQ